MNQPQILDVLVNAGICGGNISPTVLPEDTPLPYGRYDVIDVPINQDLVSAEVYQIRFTLTIWCYEYNTLYNLKNQIRALFKTKGTPILDTITEETETGYQRLDTSWYFIETN